MIDGGLLEEDDIRYKTGTMEIFIFVFVIAIIFIFMIVLI